jgi:hypothetical protein
MGCSQGAQSRQPSTGAAISGTNSSGSVANAGGSPAAANALPDTSGAAGTGNAGGTADPNGTATGGGSGGAADPATIGSTGGAAAVALNGSKTLEQCQASGQAWRAVVASGTQPNDCVDTLVSWCCTRDEIKSHFPTMAAELEIRFQKNIDTNGDVLYACSVDAKNAYSFHMAKIVGGATTYDVITASGVIPTVPTQSLEANAPSCTKPTTSSLVKQALNLNSLSE